MNMSFDDRTIAPEDLLAGRFRRVRKLGGGGMGEVFLVEDTKLYNRQFAVKMIPAILVSNRRAYEQIKKEALVTLNLVHSNIVQVRAVEENDGAPFIVMDYVEGESLADIIARKGCLKEEEALAILRPIAAALDFAHSKKVVHRDVKPSNVMVAKDGTPYILDFGIASEIKETMTRMTGNSISGTPLYMSPEQMRGAAPAPLQDVYSFAVMAYECLAGNPPFYRGDISWQIVNEVPPPLPDGISIAAGIMAGLAKTSGERPANCVSIVSVQNASPKVWKTEVSTEIRSCRGEHGIFVQGGSVSLSGGNSVVQGGSVSISGAASGSVRVGGISVSGGNVIVGGVRCQGGYAQVGGAVSDSLSKQRNRYEKDSIIESCSENIVVEAGRKLEIKGACSGNVRIRKKSTLICHGSCSGNVDIERGGRFVCFGSMSGNITNHCGAVTIHGTFSGIRRDV